MELVFATNNNHKLEEIQAMLGNSFQLKSLQDINCFDDIPETGNTLEKNASQKSLYIYDKYNINCFADDTGLEIEALNGDPGVYSARYAGDEKDAQKNMQKVLSNLQGIENRQAKFRTVISLILDGKEYQFEGAVYGTILEKEVGGKGFGYDPIFLPNGYNVSFAQMELTCKNEISHRAKAVYKLVEFLKNINL